METIKKNWKVMPDPLNKGLHINHDYRYIVTADAIVEARDANNKQHWELSEGLIICKMRDLEDIENVSNHIAKTPEYFKAIHLFEDGWGHFLKCMNFKTSAMDAEAIGWMNEISLLMRKLNNAI